MNKVKTPSVSIIIPTYNRAELTRTAVKSVLAQTFTDIEIIVVDDGSTDYTREALRAFGGKIRYLYQENAGPGPARNFGIAEARGEWIAFLDSDDLWTPFKLEFQLAETIRLGADCSFHDSRHTAGGSSAAIESWNRHVHQKSLHRPPLGTQIIDDLYGIVFSSWHFFIMSSMLVRKSTLRAVGGFDPVLRTNQDVDLYLRLAPRCRVAYIDRVMLEYSPGPERSFEVASRLAKTGPRRRKNNRARIFEDRITSLGKVISERMEAGDPARAKTAERVLARQYLSLFRVRLDNREYLRALVPAGKFFLARLKAGWPYGHPRTPGLRTAHR